MNGEQNLKEFKTLLNAYRESIQHTTNCEHRGTEKDIEDAESIELKNEERVLNWVFNILISNLKIRPWAGFNSSLEIMKLYEINGEKRRILNIFQGSLQYDNGEGGIPNTCNKYQFINWLLTNKEKL